MQARRRAPPAARNYRIGGDPGVQRAVGAVGVAAAAPALAVAGYYASEGALGGLVEALFVRAFAQLEGNSPAHLQRMFAAESFDPRLAWDAAEDRASRSQGATPVAATPAGE